MDAGVRSEKHWMTPQGGLMVGMSRMVADGRVTFENAAHDFPQRILYWREGDRLRARVEGMLEGRQMSEDYAWRRVVSAP